MRSVPPLTPPLWNPPAALAGIKPTYRLVVIGLIALVMLNNIQFHWLLSAPGGVRPALTVFKLFCVPLSNVPVRKLILIPLPSRRYRLPLPYTWSRMSSTGVSTQAVKAVSAILTYVLVD